MMYKFRASEIVQTITMIEYICMLMEMVKDRTSELDEVQHTEPNGKVIPYSTVFDQQLANITTLCDILGAQQTALFSNEIKELASGATFTVTDAAHHARDIMESLA